MLTIFSVPKPFKKEFFTIQNNAINSWNLIKPKPEIILLGKSKEIKSICKKYNLIHHPNIKTNSFGTPRVDSIFNIAKREASNKILMYINTDIIIVSDIGRIIRKIEKTFPSFLLIGRRFELPVKEKVDFKNKSWKEKILHKIQKSGYLKKESWIDYFIFTKDVFKNIPPFALGRTFWDKWLVWSARKRNIPVVDITKDFICIHQSHTYNLHNTKNILTFKKVWFGEEAAKNIKLAGGWHKGYTIKRANFYLRNQRIRKKKCYFM